jgi:hypothetical protein
VKQIKIWSSLATTKIQAPKHRMKNADTFASKQRMTNTYSLTFMLPQEDETPKTLEDNPLPHPNPKTQKS